MFARGTPATRRAWATWTGGFCCPLCRSAAGWKLPDGRWSCGRPGVSATAGTIFRGTRTPLTVWFAAGDGGQPEARVSALGLKRGLGIGPEQTAWAMLLRFRTAMVRPGRDRLTGVVEVDETFFGEPEPGRGGRGAPGKTLAAVAVKQRGGGVGRLPRAGRQGRDAMRVPARSRPARRKSSSPTGGPAACRRAGTSTSTAPSRARGPSSRRTSCWPACITSPRWPRAGCWPPTRAASSPRTCKAYLDEFAFRFNQTRHLGMLFYRLLEPSVQAPPRSYRSLVADPATGRRQLGPPGSGNRGRPPSLAGEPLERPVARIVRQRGRFIRTAALSWRTHPAHRRLGRWVSSFAHGATVRRRTPRDHATAADGGPG